MASASIHVMNLSPKVYSQSTNTMQSHINVGSGSDVTITQLAQLIQEVVAYKGSIDYDTSKPDGAPRKLMDSQKLLGLGWQPTYSLSDGIKAAYDDFLKNPSLRKK